MAQASLENAIAELQRLKSGFDPRSVSRLLSLLERLRKRRFADANQFAEYHEALLFIRAYPANVQIVRSAERSLRAAPRQLRQMEKTEVDLTPLDEADLSGIATRSSTGVFSYPVAIWLARNFPGELEIDWPGYEDEPRLAATWPRFMPLLEDETLVEAHFPYLDWLRAASGVKGERALPWLINRFTALPMSFARQAELYDSLQIYVRWKPKRFDVTRTGMRLPARSTFYHAGPLLARRDVSLSRELSARRLPHQRLSRREGAAILEQIRQTSTLRYRELHGFSYGDPASFIRFDAGRGIDIYVDEVTPDHRLPLRAYHSAFMVKNGVPIGYVEGLSLFDRMEIGFNIYYTFRDGESAYLYAQVMKIFHQLLGINCFSVDPYQIGHENEEGLASGAFWFYRKLGFQPARRELLALVQREEEKIAARPGYRTSLATLKKIAVGHVFYDRAADSGRDWSVFQVHNLGLAANRRMARDFGGQAGEFRAAAEAEVAASFGIKTNRWPELDRRAFSHLAAVLFLIEDLDAWTSEEKKLTARVIRAKGSGTESDYLRLMQKHERLRDAVLKFGAGWPTAERG